MTVAETYNTPQSSYISNMQHQSSSATEQTEHFSNAATSDMTAQSRKWVVEDDMAKKIDRLENELEQTRAIAAMPPTPPTEREDFDSNFKLAIDNIFGPELRQDVTSTSTAIKPVPSRSTKGVDTTVSAVTVVKFTPLAVRAMAPLKNSDLSQQPLSADSLRSFPKSFLTGILGGSEFSAGMYYQATGADEHSKQLGRMVKRHTYYLLEASIDPFVPTQPGTHGAKIVPFTRALEEKLVKDVPLFVCLDSEPGKNGVKDGEPHYIYMGHYSQNRWSDRLDVDRADEVIPKSVKQHWAEKLASKDRPEWMTAELIVALCPKPGYDGALPSHRPAGASEGPNEKTVEVMRAVKTDLVAYIEELLAWQKESKTIVQKLTKEGVMRAFRRADADGMPGLRFWWEYLECVGYDRIFYYLLSTALEEQGKGGAEAVLPSIPENFSTTGVWSHHLLY